MKYEQQIEETWKRLKDFQQATVEHVINRISKGQKKFLIADEVGLGKTIVAKGTIAKLYEKEYNENKNFTVIYICSNLALARQNLSKLNPLGNVKDELIIDHSEQDDRLTSLAYEPLTGPNEYKLKIRAFTPATSFDNKTKAGKADERLLLYRLLITYDEFRTRKTALKWLLRGGQRISEHNWNAKIESVHHPDKYHPLRTIRPGVTDKFYKRLQSLLSVEQTEKIFGKGTGQKSILDALLTILGERKHNCSFEGGRDILFKPYYFLISELRLQLTHVCKDYLQADLFILDEFQRFSQLIKTSETANEGEEIARAIFAKPDARVLLLSATPFKAYTNSFDEKQGEHHYSEFKTVLEFLNIEKAAPFWEQLDEKNRQFFDFIRNFHSGNRKIEDILPHKQFVEETYRDCIARTERVIVEKQDNLTITDKQLKVLQITPDDIEDYLAIDRIILAHNEEAKKKLTEVIEYVKSAPFPLSFLQDYDHHKELTIAYKENRKLKSLINKTKRAFLPVDRINNYKPLLPESRVSEPNPKLRLLYDETVRNNGYKLLWIPPSINYYTPRSGAYRQAKDFSKTLIFSSWKMVPRMISALVSYEAERLSIGKFLEKEYADKEEKERIRYFIKKKEKRYPLPLLTFRTTQKETLSGMNNFMLAYPSIYLTSLYNPAYNLVDKRDLAEIKHRLKSKIKNDLEKAGALTLGTTGGDWQKWDWYAVLLLDQTQHTQLEEVKQWLRNKKIEQEFDDQKESGTARDKHFQQIKDVLLNQEIPSLGKLTPARLDEISSHLANLCLGAPGIVAYRSLKSVYQQAGTDQLLDGAMTIGDGFISLFNKPEAIAIVKTAEKDDYYYENVLTYSVEGNIQAMLDEYIYQLHDSAGYREIDKVATLIKDILRINTGSVDVITPESLQTNRRPTFRTHYAIPFGTGKTSNLNSGKRQIKVRETFNSPFRPFVLTSTSIGQEGLDFHFYCSKIIHWNLPGNPIDLEQREGRIKRYKSLLIRRNVAKKYIHRICFTDLDNNLWDQIFEYAKSDKEESDHPCDLIPYWHINAENDRINAIIPVYPYSKDLHKYRYIKEVLANYRLTFGQPRQEELISALKHLNPKEQEDLKKVLLNLSPVLKK